MPVHSVSKLCATLGLSALMLSAPLAQTAASTPSASTGTYATSSSGGDDKSTLVAAKLGQGETNIATALAKESLAQAGISQPTPAQMQTALNGGEVKRGDGSTVSLVGVLAQRQSGLGWGQIAQSMGVKLGSLVSASKNSQVSKNPAPTAADSAPSARAEKAKAAAAQSKSDGASHAAAGAKSGKSGNTGNGGSGGKK